ncbi:uncharacterized protein LOC113789075 [Dermatophagoides pteronyssinus]|uniref:uncharacterized protein LOC113789075 n=1 Tax=Dermatophagoides pteronyssinus TaxID=6956 RepID=UPI003F67FBE6
MFIIYSLIIINIFLDYNNNNHFCLAKITTQPIEEIDGLTTTTTTTRPTTTTIISLKSNNNNNNNNNLQTLLLSSPLLSTTIMTTTKSSIISNVQKSTTTTTTTMTTTSIESTHDILRSTLNNNNNPYNPSSNELNDNDSIIKMTTSSSSLPYSSISNNYFESLLLKPLQQKQLSESEESSSSSEKLIKSDTNLITFSSDLTTTFPPTTTTTTTMTITVSSIDDNNDNRKNTAARMKLNFNELTVVDHVIILIGGSLSLITILGNVLVMVAFKIDRQLQTISNYFLLSLAVADFLIGFISMPLSLIYIVVDGWPLGYSICDIWLAIDYLNSNASVLNLLLISFDRYFSVTRPLTYRAKRTTRRACIFIAFAWIVSALLWPPWIFAWPKIEGRRTVPEYQCYIPFLESNIWVTTITAIMAFWLPVTIMCILYWRIWRETENRYRELTSLVVISPATVNQPTATIAQTATTSITKLSTPTASSMVTGCITAGTNIGTISTTTTTTNSDSRGKIKLKNTSTNNSHHIIDENNKSNHNHQQQQQQNNQNSSIKMPKRPIHLPNCPHSLIQRNKIRTNQTILSATTTTSQQEIDKDLQQQQQKSGTVVRRLPHDKPSSISILGRTMSHTSIGQQSYVEPIPKIFSTHDYCDEIKLEDIQHTTEGLVCLKSPANIIEQDYENELFEINATTDLDESKTSETRQLSFWSWIWNRLTFNHNNSRHKRCSSSGSSSNNNKRKQLKKKYSIQELNSESGIMVQGDSMMNESTTTTTTTTIKCPGCAYRLRRQRKRRLQKIKQIQQQKSLESEQTNINEQQPIMTIDKKSKKFINQSSLDNMSTTIQKQKQKQKQKHSEINYHIREMESINDDNQQSDSSIYTIVIKLQDPKDYNDNQRIMNESIKMLRSNRSKRSISSSIPSTTTTAAMIRQDSDQQQSMLDQVYIDENYDDSGDNDDDDDDDDEDDELDDDDDDDLDDDVMIDLNNQNKNLQTNVLLYNNNNGDNFVDDEDDDDDDDFDEDDDEDYDEDDVDDGNDNNEPGADADDNVDDVDDDSDSSIQIKNCCPIRCCRQNSIVSSTTTTNQQHTSSQLHHQTPILITKQKRQQQQQQQQQQGSILTTKSTIDQKQQQQQHDTHLLQHQQSITSQATTTTTTATVTTTATPSSATFTRVRATFQPKSERKAAKTLSAILLAFIVTWTPYNVLVLLKTFYTGLVDPEGGWWQFAYFLCYVNSTLNPLLYALCNANFRRTYVRILTCKFRRGQQPSSIGSAAAAVHHQRRQQQQQQQREQLIQQQQQQQQQQQDQLNQNQRSVHRIHGHSIIGHHHHHSHHHHSHHHHHHSSHNQPHHQRDQQQQQQQQSHITTTNENGNNQQQQLTTTTTTPPPTTTTSSSS